MDATLRGEIEGAVYSLPTEVEGNLLRIERARLLTIRLDIMLTKFE